MRMAIMGRQIGLENGRKLGKSQWKVREFRNGDGVATLVNLKTLKAFYDQSVALGMKL